VKRLGEIAERLIANGRDAAEPAAVVERGTTAAQRTVVATLSELPGAAADAEVAPPAIVLTGPVAGRRATIEWLERRPLHRRSVVVTRARPQASGLAATLATLGAEVVELPVIRIVPRIDSAEVRDAIRSIHAYALVCVTSANGARLLFESLDAEGRDARALANATVAAIGPGTAAALAEHGIRADLVPERALSEGLVEALAGLDLEGRPVLVARAAEGRDVLPRALRERGAEVDEVTLYETVAERPEAEAVEAALQADYLTFTSSSTVRNFVGAVGGRGPDHARVVSIGPVTSEAARDAGIRVDVEAERHDVGGLVEALLADARQVDARGSRP
jgi:uroporphyrinogen III methyltransferase/synthase